MNQDYRLDRTSASTLTFKEADKSMSQFHDNSWRERLAIANRLISIAYNFPLNNPPKMDKTFFEIHQHNE